MIVYSEQSQIIRPGAHGKNYLQILKKYAVVAAILPFFLDGKLNGREVGIAFEASKKNKPVCFFCYGGRRGCRATRENHWPRECKLCKRLYNLSLSEGD